MTSRQAAGLGVMLFGIFFAVCFAIPRDAKFLWLLTPITMAVMYGFYLLTAVKI